jgi:flagellar biosynthetic protein FliR
MTQTALLVFARSAGMVFRAPGFAHPSVPAPVRAGFALALALAVAPHVPVARPFGAAAFAVAVAGETLLGALLGTGAALLYDGAYYAGRLVDDYVGVRASVPTANVASAQAFGRLWSSVFLAGFFLLDGYVPVIGAFAQSFAHIPAGTLVARDALLHVALALPATIVRAAFAIAAPAIAVVLTVQIALAAVARVVPRFASFSLAFPIVFAAALLVTFAGVPLLAPAAAHPWLVLPWSSPP